jgi:CDGSH-type Zn-finger protein
MEFDEIWYLTLGCSYLKPYCMGRKTAFFFSGHLIYLLKQEHFRAFRLAGDI